MRNFENLTCFRFSIVEAINQHIALVLGLAVLPDAGAAIVDQSNASGDDSEKIDDKIPKEGSSDAKGNFKERSE